MARKSVGHDVRLRRIYDEPGADDGKRVLVDRVWPRGMRKQDAHIDEWCREVAPSKELRTWYGHDPSKYAEFERRYRAELADDEKATAFAHLTKLADSGTLTLLTATKDIEISQAAVLTGLLR